MKLRLAVDTGGTFTDIVLMDEETGTVWTDKVPSTPDNPARACVTGTRRILEKAGASPEELTLYLHGTTVATNALLEYKGSPTALITTKGFSDIPDIARQTRPKLYDFRARKPKPLIDRDMRYELDERVLYDGSVLKTPDMADIDKIVLDIKKRGIESVAVCLLHSYANPVNENLIEDAFKRLYPECFVTYSAKVLPEYREYERMSTVSVNAYVMPNVGRYVVKLQDALKDSGVNSELYVMQSKDVLDIDYLKEHSIRSEYAMCNLIGQAKKLNAENVQLNIILGLCVGHDTLFIKYSDAPVTYLAVKDRCTGHNPLSPIYQHNNLFERIHHMDVKFDDEL